MKKNLKARSVVIACDASCCAFTASSVSPRPRRHLMAELPEEHPARPRSEGRQPPGAPGSGAGRRQGRRRQTMERLKEDLKKQNITLGRHGPQRSADRSTTPTTSRSASRASLPRSRAPSAPWSPSASQLCADRRQLDRLQDEAEADGTAGPQARHRAAHHGHHRQPHRPARAGRDSRSSSTAAPAPITRSWCSCPAWTIPARVKELIGTAAVLEIDEVKDGPFPSRDALLAQHGGVLPLNTKPVKAMPRGGAEGEMVPGRQDAGVSGREMRNARPGQDEYPQVGDQLHPVARRRQALRPLHGGAISATAWRWCSTIRSSASPPFRPRSRIPAASPAWAASRKRSTCRSYLRSGSLPASVKYHGGAVGRTFAGRRFDPRRDCGRSRGPGGGHRRDAGLLQAFGRECGAGADSEHGRAAGGAISYFHAVLTLPGIAGVILTIGMAVDSNVLIFERIREELRSGKGVIAAVDAGFGKAWWTIVDTHVTTVVSCASSSCLAKVRSRVCGDT